MLGAMQADYMAVNRAGLKVQRRIGWWVTYHPEAFYHEGWGRQRETNGGNMDFIVVAHQRNVWIERSGLSFRQFSGPSRTGSSALLAVLFGLSLGYQHVILAGVPLDHPDYRSYREGWKLKSKNLAGRVSSLSGWTKTFLEGLNHGA